MATVHSGLQQVPAPTLALGLNLRDGVDSVGPGYAINALDADFTERGGVRSRYGHELVGSLPSSPTPPYTHMAEFRTFAGGRRLVIAGQRDIRAYTPGGSTTPPSIHTAGVGSTFWASQRIGQPNAERLFMANGVDTLRTYDGSVVTAPTITGGKAVDGSGGTAGQGHGKPIALAILPTSNRLMLCGFNGALDGPAGETSSPNHVYFMQPGDPLGSIGVDGESDQLRPGDGDRILGACTWREFAFVFKGRSIYAFNGESTDARGITKFYWRPIDAGIGLITKHACCVGRDGVYFVGDQGVYRLTGGEPELLSDIIAPIFTGETTSFYDGGKLNRAAVDQVRISWGDEKVYVHIPVDASTVANRTLVYDTQQGNWTVWKGLTTASALFDDGVIGPRMWVVTSDSRFGYLSNVLRYDKLLAMRPLWRSGYLDYNDPSVKTLLENKVWGQGLFNVRTGIDYQNAMLGTKQVDLRPGSLDVWGTGSDGETWGDGTGADTWGPVGQVGVAVARYALRGTTFSVQFDGDVTDTINPAGWTVHQLTQHLISPDWPATERPTS